jgi:predicted RNA binding protein YcfA (HicA-like mRNA interferase family)
MMAKIPIVTSRELIRALEKTGFEVVRQRGSHIRMLHSDGRVTTIPVHAGQDISRGLLRKILRDSEVTLDELIELLN